MKQEIKERVEKIRKGEVPEGYKKTKVGIIPDDWDANNLDQFTINILDGTHSTPKYTNEGVPFYSVENVTKNDFNDTKFISKSEHILLSKRCLVEKDNILMTRIGVIGETKLIDWNVNASIYVSLALIKLKPHTVANYILNYTKSSEFHKEAHKLSLQNATPQKINLGEISKIQIKHPTKYKEQEKIANILSTWNTAIELKKELIEEKKELKRGLVQKLLVGKLRFKEHVKNPKLQEVKRYSTLPEEWSVKKASSIFSNISKKNNGNEQLLSATQNNGVIPRDMLDGDVMSPSGDTKSYKLVEDGDFVISLRSFQGGIEYSSYQGIISPAYTVLKNQIPICKDFYRHLFKSRLFIDRLASSVIGIRDGKQISYDDFSFMLLPYPELKEQEKIASMLNSIDNEVNLLNKELNQFKEQKRGLMQLLLTGIIRVEVD